MARIKGTPKTGGRKQGTLNKNTEQTRTMLHNFIDNNMESLQSEFDQLEVKDRLNFIERLLKYILPAPLHPLELLTDQQLDELINRLKKQNQ